MTQRQSEQPPLDIHDMWHLSDDEERRDKRLSGEVLDISWATATVKQQVTGRFYEASASEGKCTEAACEYSTHSRKKLLDHIVTHYIVYVTDCNYITSRKDSAVKHLRTCHNRRGSIIQADTGGEGCGSQIPTFRPAAHPYL